MKKDPQIFLKHILESAEQISRYTKQLSKKEFLKDAKTQDAVVRRLEIIGEAVKNLPADFKKKYPTVNWRKMAGMRDVLIHKYFGINIERVWETTREATPNIKNKISKILKQISLGL